MKNVYSLSILTIGIFTSIISYSSELYKNPSLSDEARVDDLLSRMTLIEKVGQMSQFVGPEHIARSEKNMTIEEMQAGDTFGIYPNLHSSQIPDVIKKGRVGSFLHVKNPKEANFLQKHAIQSRLGIPLLIGIDAIHGNGLVKGATIYPSPITMASSWNLDLVEQREGAQEPLHVADVCAECRVAHGTRERARC